ncbi:MAG TPA: ABC transporter ATP-binding protein [Thermoplasmata archaeon]|nr:ABC transporter ATP-binding protein [Thermoplasmata archaeon]
MAVDQMSTPADRPMTAGRPLKADAAAPASSGSPRLIMGRVDTGDDVLDVRDLRTYFFTYDGVVKALDGVDLSIRKGETLGLVGETGCGKSVTAFSVMKLLADPPGRIMGGEIRFKGANLLYGVDQEATFKPVPHSNRVKVKRRYSRIRRSQERMAAIRGSGISMIFQEPSSALNPIFSIANQLSEALMLHGGVEIIEELLQPPPTPGAVSAAIDRLLEQIATSTSGENHEAARQFAESLGRPSLASQAYTILKEQRQRPDEARKDLERVVRRLHVGGLQRRYLRQQMRVYKLRRTLHEMLLEEMRRGAPTGAADRRVRNRLRLEWILGLGYALWGLRGFVRKPVVEETFWRSVTLLEGVSIANPAQVARGYPHELSGGMLQRVMIAMALSSNPALLLADEPTTALDVTIQAQILSVMRDLKTRVGSSILLITHDLGVIAEMADRVSVMYAGNVVETAPVRDLYRRPLHPYTQGLLNSIPRMDDPNKTLESIPGSVPNLIYPPSGCRFHPRCPHAMEICKEARPPTTIEGEDHTVACYLYHGPPARST